MPHDAALSDPAKGETAMEPTLTVPSQTTRIRTETAQPCIHGRMVDEVRCATGAKTGRLICLECQAEFPDPASRKPKK